MINIGKEWDWMYNLVKNEKEMAIDTRNEVKVKHPDYGHVIFHGPTARQIEILEEFANIDMLLKDVIAQNKMLGDMIRNRDVEIETLIEEIKKLKKNGENPYTDYLT